MFKEISVRRIRVIARINLNKGRRRRDLTLKALSLSLQRLCSSQEQKFSLRLFLRECRNDG